MKSFLYAFLGFILVGGLALTNAAGVSAQAPGVIVVIGSDTTWTKADSPHDLTGPLLVTNGATLTIEAGVTVNLNSYDIRVEGTLRAVGSSAEKIHLNNGNYLGSINFEPNSTPWNEQTGSGCIIENAICNTCVYSNVSLKIINSVINYDISVGDSSLIFNNELGCNVNAGNLNTISNNIVEGDISVERSNVICNNIITGEIHVGESSEILNNTITGHVLGASATISDNIITGLVMCYSSNVSNNVIAGGQPTYDWVGRPNDSSSAVYTYGASCVVSNNVIMSPLGGYGVTITAEYTLISGNVIFDCKTGIRAAGDSTIEGNLITNNSTPIAIGHIVYHGFNTRDYGMGDVVIRNNTISNNSWGIGGGNGGSAVIEKNLIANSSSGISASLPVTIQRNTISNTSVAISLGNCSSVVISYNNIENYSENSIYLRDSLNDIDITNNWWGTTDTQAINLTIHDSKYDFDLGTVIFTPFLTEPYPEAMPNSNPEFPSNIVIPEFPSWIILPLLVMATVAVIICRKRLTKMRT